MTTIMAHDCPNKFQDSAYGAGMRLFNHAPDSGRAPGRWRCTVCGKTSNGVSVVTPKKKDGKGKK